MSELRWNPVLREWVITATHRQDRTFFPPPEYCPLCPTKAGAFPTEIPGDTFDMVVFENRFPSLRCEPPDTAIAGTDLYPVQPAAGACEVIVYSSKHDAELADMPVSTVEKLVNVWADRFAELETRADVQYILQFENKGREIGVTLSHPHGQIYAYPFIPPIIERELAGCLTHYQAHGECLICRIQREELAVGARVVLQNASFVAVVPFFARYPYEVHVIATRHVTAVTELSAVEKRDFAEALHAVTRAYNALWNRSIPYIMVVHQRPTDGAAYPYYHLHVEFYPPYRTPDKLKFLAGSEAGAGAYINDTLAEEKAQELRVAIMNVEG